jgi:hypothetical protein
MTEAHVVPRQWGTIVYVHGASDRSSRVSEHVERIERSLSLRDGEVELLVAEWGDRAGPDLSRICRALPDTADPTQPCAEPDDPSRIQKLRALPAALLVAKQFLRRSSSNWLKVRATEALLPLRDDLMHEILGVADVLVYQRDRSAMRDVVRESLASAPKNGRPLIAVGNSLGGIIPFDLLREPGAPKPDLFVTIGSQAPALQTVGALGPGENSPFTPWLNIYDRRDFFGFKAYPVWPVDGVEDREVFLKRGFPEVHGPEYFSHMPVWNAIFDHPAMRNYEGNPE